jgi:hypothetical protein
MTLGTVTHRIQTQKRTSVHISLNLVVQAPTHIHKFAVLVTRFHCMQKFRVACKTGHTQSLRIQLISTGQINMNSRTCSCTCNSQSLYKVFCNASFVCQSLHAAAAAITVTLHRRVAYCTVFHQHRSSQVSSIAPDLLRQQLTWQGHPSASICSIIDSLICRKGCG